MAQERWKRRSLKFIGDNGLLEDSIQNKLKWNINLKKCPICGREVDVHGGNEEWKPTFYDPDSVGNPYNINCDCGLEFSIGCCDYGEFQNALNNRIDITNDIK